ncbi:MAG: hypothetical protein JF586_23530 [Burkholderiales bacterium]|nr:hypothetical protein [Burkholderiales bacterium]
MLNSETLEVAIGMVFLFLLMSLICTAIKEWIEALLKWRAMDLERAMRTLLADDDGSTTQALYTHPIIYSLFQGSYDAAQLRSSWLVMGTGADKHMRLGARRNLPSYIPTAHFATAFIDYVARGPATPGAATSNAAPGPLTIDLLRRQAAQLPEHLSRTVIAGIDYANGDIARVRKAVEQWFDGAMDRASGWYKRRTQALLFMVGLLTAVLLNVDALHILHRLTHDKTYRDVVVSRAAAAKAPASASAGDELASIALARGELDAVAMPIGWESPTTQGDQTQLWPTQFCSTSTDGQGTLSEACTFGRNPVYAVVRMVFGWLVTALAVMLGAPFWFDVLNRIMVIRSTVKPHEKSPEEPSQDGGSDPVQRVVLSADPAPAATPPDPPTPDSGAPQPAA